MYLITRKKQGQPVEMPFGQTKLKHTVSEQNLIMQGDFALNLLINFDINYVNYHGEPCTKNVVFFHPSILRVRPLE